MPEIPIAWRNNYGAPDCCCLQRILIRWRKVGESAMPCSILLADFNLFTQKKGGMRSGKSDGGRGNKENERGRERERGTRGESGL